jgi:hypothetical protein
LALARCALALTVQEGSRARRKGASSLCFILNRRKRVKLLGRLIATSLVAVAAAMGSISAAQAASTPILIKSCVVAKPRPLSHMAGGTTITYVNLGHRTASAVIFAVGYRNAAHNFIRRVTDEGSFAPGATITHTLSLYNDVTYAGSATTLCVPVEVKYAGGTVWMAPSRPGNP